MTSEEIEKGFREIWALFKDTDKRFKDTDIQIRETDRILEELLRDTKKTVAETSKTVEETGVYLKKMGERVDKTSEAVYALTGKWSRFVEGLIVPAAERLFKERGIIIDKVSQRVKTHHNGDTMEIDILAINGEYAVLIEAKSTLKIDDIKEHIARLADFKKFFPEYKDKKTLGAVGGIVIEENSDIFAYRQGLYVIAESGETVKILNDKNFTPKVW